MTGMEKVIKCIKENKSFLITTHINPEGDAVGSSIALALILKSSGKGLLSAILILFQKTSSSCRIQRK